MFMPGLAIASIRHVLKELKRFTDDRTSYGDPYTALRGQTSYRPTSLYVELSGGATIAWLSEIFSSVILPIQQKTWSLCGSHRTCI